MADEIAQLTKAKQAAVAGGEAAGSVDPVDEQLELLGASTWFMSSFSRRPNTAMSWATSTIRLQTQLDNLHKFGPPEAKPYSFLLLEEIRDGLATQQERETAFQADLAAAQQVLEQARVNLEHARARSERPPSGWPAIASPISRTHWPAAVHLADLNSTIASRNGQSAAGRDRRSERPSATWANSIANCWKTKKNSSLPKPISAIATARPCWITWLANNRISSDNSRRPRTG